MEFCEIPGVGLKDVSVIFILIYLSFPIDLIPGYTYYFSTFQVYISFIHSFGIRATGPAKCGPTSTLIYQGKFKLSITFLNFTEHIVNDLAN